MSHIKEYLKDNSLNDFYSAVNIEGEEIAKASKRYAKAKSEYEDAVNYQNLLYSKAYKYKYSTPKKVNYLQYTGRNDTYCFSIPDGQKVDPNAIGEPYSVTRVSSKNGHFACVVGYCYPKGAVVVKSYDYIINSTNTQCKMILATEHVYNVFTKETVGSPFLRSTNMPAVYAWNTSADEFFSGFYEEPIESTLKIGDISDIFDKNAAAEVIIKTAPSAYVKEKLLHLNFTKAEPCFKLLGFSKDGYDKMVKEGLIDLFVGIKDKMANYEVFHYTEDEWIKMAKDINKMQEDLQFYDIGYNEYRWRCDTPEKFRLFTTLINAYSSSKRFQENYTFGKFANYIVNETINQGYTNITGYIKELDDYIIMCSDHDVRPSLYTSYLKLTHDIMARNQKIRITPDIEAQLREAYSTYNKTIEDDGYKIIAPKSAKEIIEEGNELNHCVASYIKRICNNECLIFFFRKTGEENQSYITLEVVDNEIVQARGQHNHQPNDEESKILHKLAAKAKLSCNW